MSCVPSRVKGTFVTGMIPDTNMRCILRKQIALYSSICQVPVRFLCSGYFRCNSFLCRYRKHDLDLLL